LHHRPRLDDHSRGIPLARRGDDHRDRGGTFMSNLSRRALLTSGVVAAGAALGTALAAAGRRFGLVPPDANGIYGPGETLAYASHRLFGRHAMAREFPRSMISAKPFANSLSSPPNESFKRHQAAGFANWRLKVHGQVARPTSLSLTELRAMERRSQITEVSCE